MMTVHLKLTWQTRTANLEGELRGEVTDAPHKQTLIGGLSMLGFRVVDVGHADADADADPDSPQQKG